MTSDPRKRQRKLERRDARRKSKHQLLVREKNAGIGERLAAAAQYPVLSCGATESLWTRGMGSVWLSRELPNGSIALGVFLVDRSCLGVKDAIAEITSRFTYEDKFMSKFRRQEGARELAPAAARQLVESAVDYARRLGLAPHADYHKAAPIFGTIDPAGCAEEFEFGQNGKPHFIAGPYDSPERCRMIINTLLQSCGPEGFHYTIPFDMLPGVLPGALRQKPARVIGPDQNGVIREYRLP
jgi:hypothetical protein